MLKRLVAALALTLTLSPALAQQLPPVNAAMEASGTFSWVVHAMEYFGTAAANGIRVNGTVYASKQATELALRGGQADIAVDDFLAPALLRSRGVAVSGVYPFAKAVGGLVVPASSDIDSIADLPGRTIAVASLRDKSLLILRALAASQYGFDPQDDSEVVVAAAPLMLQLVQAGDVEAALPFWHFVARIEASGNGREVISVGEMLNALGLPADLPNLMLVARDDMDPALKRAFLRTFVDTIEAMVATPNDDPFWQTILDEELYTLPDPAQFGRVIDRWRAGTPEAWTEAQIDGLVRMVETMVELAGADVVGVEGVPHDAYTTEFAPN